MPLFFLSQVNVIPEKITKISKLTDYQMDGKKAKSVPAKGFR
jgi:hypothetical protein